MSGLTATSGSLNDLYFTSTAPTLNYSTGANTGLETSGDGLYLMGGDGSNLNVLSPSTTTGTIPISGSTSGTSGSTTQNQLLQQGYDTGISKLEGQLGTLDSQEKLAVKNVNDQYDSTLKVLNRDYGLGQNNLKVATDNVNESKTRSLSNLGDWLRGMGQGYQNQLGTMGAGDSSAAGLINFALGKQGGRERGGILEDAGQQLYGIDQQMTQLQNAYDDQIDSLVKWKDAGLNDITIKYQQARDEINNTISDYRARAYAEQNLMTQAINELQNLENAYKTQATNLQTQYGSLVAGQNINPELLTRQTTPVRQAQLSGIGLQGAVTPQSSGAINYLYKKDENAFANPLGV